MFKLKCDDFLVFDEVAGEYKLPDDQKVRDETERNRWKTTGWTILKDWRLYLMLVPMLLVYILWKYMPMYELVSAFQVGDKATVAERYWYGLEQFKTLLVGDTTVARDFWRAFRNTFIIAFYGLLFGFPVPIILALFFNEVRSNVARSILQVCVYLPKFMSTVVVTSLALVLFRASSSTTDYGIVSKFLVLITGNNENVVAAAGEGMLYSARYFRALYVVTELWEHAGYDSIVFFAAVIAVSPTSYEAAQIDGAGKMAQMRYVVIPSILSTVIIMLIMKIGSLLSVGYEKIYLLTPSESYGNYAVADVVSTFANNLSSPRLAGAASRPLLAIAAEMINNVIGMILVIGANAIARKASDVSLY